MACVVDYRLYTLKELAAATGTGVETLRRWTRDDGSGWVLRKHPRSKGNLTLVSGLEWRRFVEIGRASCRERV